MKRLTSRTRQAALALVLALSYTFNAALPAQAQGADWATDQATVSPPALSFGLRVGLSQTEFAGGAVGSVDPGAGLSGGGYLTYRIHPNVSLQPEVLFTRRTGVVDHSRVFEGSRNVAYALGFIEAPLLVKAHLPAQNGPVPYLAAGPYASMRLHEHASDQNRVVDDVDLDSELRDWDYGLTAGLGMEALGSRRAVSFEVRYAWGLANLFREANRPDFRVRGLTFTAGFGF